MKRKKGPVEMMFRKRIRLIGIILFGIVLYMILQNPFQNEQVEDLKGQVVGVFEEGDSIEYDD